MREAVLITGVSSGIGLSMTKKFLARGYRVFGSVRSEDKAQALQTQLGSGFSPLVFDVRKADELKRADDDLGKLLEGAKLSALINNAGGAEIGPLMHIPIADFAAQLDTLVVGQLAVIQRFHKHLAASGTGRRPGRIVNISSVSGEHANPYFGAYCAGKHALEGMSKTLRAELARVGTPVIVVAPANIATSIWSKQTDALIDPYRDTRYYPELQQALRHIGTSVVRQAMSVEEFAEALYEIVRADKPADRYTLIKAKRRFRPFARARVQLIES